MHFTVNAEELRRAISEIEIAEKNGFMYCQAVFALTKAGKNLSDCQAEYSDLIEKAHPTNPSLNWGRFQSVSKENKFENGKLVKLNPHP